AIPADSQNTFHTLSASASTSSNQSTSFISSLMRSTLTATPSGCPPASIASAHLRSFSIASAGLLVLTLASAALRVSPVFAQKLRQFCDIRRDPPCFVTGEPLGTMSAIPQKADITEHDWDVRFVPKADIVCCAHSRWRARLFADLFLLKPATLLPERADPRENLLRRAAIGTNR